MQLKPVEPPKRKKGAAVIANTFADDHDSTRSLPRNEEITEAVGSSFLYFLRCYRHPLLFM